MTAYGRLRQPGKIDPLARSVIPPPTSGMHAEFWATDLAGNVDGSTVATWADRSGNGRDLTQASPGLRPLFRQSVASLNTQEAVEFDGVDDWMRATWAATSQPVTYLAVARIISLGTGSRFVADKATGTSAMAFYWTAGVGWSLYAGTSEWLVASPAPATGAHAMRALLNGTSSRANLDGTLMSAATDIGTGQSDGVTLAARRDAAGPANMAVAYFGVYVGDATAAGWWSGFCTWVADSYGLTIA